MSVTAVERPRPFEVKGGGTGRRGARALRTGGGRHEVHNRQRIRDAAAASSVKPLSKLFVERSYAESWDKSLEEKLKALVEAEALAHVFGRDSPASGRSRRLGGTGPAVEVGHPGCTLVRPRRPWHIPRAAVIVIPSFTASCRRDHVEPPARPPGTASEEDGTAPTHEDCRRGRWQRPCSPAAPSPPAAGWGPRTGGTAAGRGRHLHRVRARWAVFAAEMLDVQPDDELLDIGCGPGAFLATKAQHARRVVGLDPSRTMLDEAKRRLDGLPPRARPGW